MTAPARRWRALLVATVDWVTVAAAASAVFGVVVLGGGAWLGEPGSSHLGLSLVAAVIVAAMIEPVRRRTDVLVRRLVADPRTEPYEVLRDFTERLSASQTVEDLTQQMAEVLGRGTRGQWTQVWLRIRGEFRLVAEWPPGPAPDGRDRARVMAPGLSPETDVRSVAVGHGDEVIGVLRVAERPARPLTQVELRLFADLAGQAALLLGRAQVLAELNARVEELATQSARLHDARLELVSAADEERRRLERDLHDGAQQQLVALSINLGLAETLAASDPDQALRVIREQVPAARRAIATLLSLAAGRGSQRLTEAGLGEALRDMTRDEIPRVEVHAPALGRFDPQVEETVYFCASEAVQNAIKHSGGDRVVVEATVVDAGSMLHLTVRDNGSGLPGSASGGSGLSSMRARVDAVRGRLDVTSAPGAGTEVMVRVPAVGWRQNLGVP